MTFTRVQILSLVAKMATEYDVEFGEGEARVIAGNVLITEAGTTLSNLSVIGDLIIAPKVGDGDVILDNVVVTGTMFVMGGGAESIVITGANSSVGRVVVNNAGSDEVRIVVEAGAMVIALIVASGSDVIIEGTFVEVIVDANVVVTIQNAEIGVLGVTNEAELNIVNSAIEELFVETVAVISIDEDSTVEELVVYNSAVEIDNEGTIAHATVPVDVVVTGNAPEVEVALSEALANIYAG
jgi:hypothetical protein